MTTAEAPAEKRTRKSVDRNAFAAAMGAVSDANVKPKTTATSSFNPLLEAFEDSWNNGKYEPFRRNVNGKSVEVEEWSGKSKSMTIASDSVDDAKQLVVDAAKRLNVGYRFRAPEDETFTGEDGSTLFSVVYFWAHEKSERARKSGKDDDGSADETADEDASEPQPA